MLLLKINEKGFIVEKHRRREESGEKAAQGTIAVYTKEKFRLDCIPTQSSLSRILKDGCNIVNASDSARVTVMHNCSAIALRLGEALFK